MGGKKKDPDKKGSYVQYHPDMQFVVIRELQQEDYQWTTLLQGKEEVLVRARSMNKSLQEIDERRKLFTIMETMEKQLEKEGEVRV